MAPVDPTASSSESSASALEGRLGNLILTNARDGARSTADETPPPQFSHRSVQPDGQPLRGDAAAADASAKNKAGRRRPNQAQRRQMSSQFSVPIDTRAPPPAPFSAKPHPGPAAHDPRYRHPHDHGHTGSQSYGVNAGRPPHAPSPFHQRDPSTSARGAALSHFGRGNRMLYDPHRQQFAPEVISAQAALLDGLCWQVVADYEIEISEIAEKEAFRQRIEAISQQAIARHEEEQASLQGFPAESVELKCFGSLSSGFATKASDMDLGLLSPLSRVQPEIPGSAIPRLLEKAFLDAGLGARLLDKTRVPIIKLCEKPPETLRQDLLANREKWEKGADDKTHESRDDRTHENREDDEPQNGGGVAAGAQENKQPAESATTELDSPTPTDGHFYVPSRDGGGTQRLHLRQGECSFMTDYYALARRVLRKAGGRDVTLANYHEFTDRDWAVLNRVCQAFVDGLSNTDLRQRLAHYPSASFRPVDDNTESHHSLLGVFLQAEGEHILHTWDTWSFRDSFQSQQSYLDQAVMSWKAVQSALSFGIDPVGYAKELQMALARLRRIPSIQLSSLEQAQQETPRQYLARIKAILDSFTSPHSGLPYSVEQAAIDRYISGIYQRHIRDAIKTSIAESPELAELEGVACLHRSLHLARELERAAEKGVYQGTQVDDLAEYIGILRSRPRRLGKHSFMVEIPSQHSALFERIRELQDPHGMAPYQPRDRYRDSLEFPKSGAGVQCDINFSAHLALQNTLLLRCYSHTDTRVRPMVLFIKHWAKVRSINSGYRGTLSSYGYVLMVLHYLTHVVQPFVCPNLQQLAPQPPPNLSPAEIENTIVCRGFNVEFWRNEQEILQFAHANQLNHNAASIGHLLRGFFEYFAHNSMMSSGQGRGFDWGRDVLSLRTPSGLLSKQEKGWTGAKTVFEAKGAGAGAGSQPEPGAAQAQAQANPPTAGPGGDGQHPKAAGRDGDVKEVRHRYLFAIEDPFELDHNVARTVTHNGIVSIRDEFRRAWRIIRSAGGGPTQENLLQDANEGQEKTKPFSQLLNEIHGPYAQGGAVV